MILWAGSRHTTAVLRLVTGASTGAADGRRGCEGVCGACCLRSAARFLGVAQAGSGTADSEGWLENICRTGCPRPGAVLHFIARASGNAANLRRLEGIVRAGSGFPAALLRLVTDTGAGTTDRRSTLKGTGHRVAAGFKCSGHLLAALARLNDPIAASRSATRSPTRCPTGRRPTRGPTRAPTRRTTRCAAGRSPLRPGGRDARFRASIALEAKTAIEVPLLRSAWITTLLATTPQAPWKRIDAEKDTANFLWRAIPPWTSKALTAAGIEFLTCTLLEARSFATLLHVISHHVVAL